MQASAHTEPEFKVRLEHRLVRESTREYDVVHVQEQRWESRCEVMQEAVRERTEIPLDVFW